MWFQVNHPSVEEEYKNAALIRPFRISVRYFFLQPFVLAAFFVLFYSQFEALLVRLQVAVPLYQQFRGLYFTHLFWVTAVLPQEFHTFFTFQISHKFFLFSLLQSFLTTTLAGLIVSKVYASDVRKSRLE